MEKQKRSIKKIDKKSIKDLSFNRRDVFTNQLDQQRRMTELQKAAAYHTTSPHSIQIIFESSEGLKMVETAEFRLNKEYVSLMDGCFIPMRKIVMTRAIFN